MSWRAERWAPVAGYEGLYAVSNLGRVRSESRITPHGHRRGGYLLKPHINAHGYLQISLCRDGHRRTSRVHVLMAAAFLGPRPYGTYIHHKDGKKLRNVVGNIAYVTPLQHNQHHFAQNPCGACALKGERHTQAKLSDVQVSEIRKSVLEGLNQRRAAQLFGISQSNVSLIINRKTRNNPSKL